MKQLFIGALFTLLWGCKSEVLPVIQNPSSQGTEPQISWSSLEEFSSNTKALSTATHRSMEDFLQTHNKIDFADQLKLRTVSVGLGLNAQVGIGSAKIGITPRLRLIYSNSKKPQWP